jgi:uncharacterized protein (TIGR03086 family)
MSDPTFLLEKAQKTTESVVAGVKPDQYSKPTSCAEFDVKSLLNHMIGGTFMFGTIISGGQLPAGDAPDIVGGGAEPAPTYRQAADLSLSAWRQDGSFDRSYQFPFGEIPANYAFGIQMGETLVHGWDLANATGQSYEPDDDVVSAVYQGAVGNIAPEMRGPGKFFGAEVPVPDDAPMLTKVLGYMGRKV